MAPRPSLGGIGRLVGVEPLKSRLNCQVIVIDDNDGDDQSDCDTCSISSAGTMPLQANNVNVIDLTDEDQGLSSDRQHYTSSLAGYSTIHHCHPNVEISDDSDGDFDSEDYLTDEGFDIFLRSWNGSQPAPHLLLSRAVVSFAVFDNIIVEPGMTVELLNGNFLRITEVLQDQENLAFFLQGRHLSRLEGLGDEFPRWARELCWTVKITSNGMEIPIEDTPITDIKRIRKVNFTNRRHKVNHHAPPPPGEFCCRLKRIICTKRDIAIRYLYPEEADEGYRVPSTSLRLNWRGETRLFGSVDKPEEPPMEFFDVEAGRFFVQVEADEDSSGKHTRLYSFGDSFCGAGGVSCGARSAGLSLSWGFDHNNDAVSTYLKNYDGVICEASNVEQFLTGSTKDLRVDVCHASPPCQTWSAAHTIDGKNDDNNSAVTFGLSDLINRVKPRIFTIEQTSGLFERHRQVFDWIAREIIQLGFSLHFKVVKCSEYGVPQDRKRLIVIASAPGEALPSIPRPTHGHPDSGLLPYVTIGTAIAGIPHNFSNHDTWRVAYSDTKPPFDAESLAKTITCGGGTGNYHPSGERGYTPRELACLQTFPRDYQFSSIGIRAQIGNAVPPILSEKIYKAIIQSLQQTDEDETRARTSLP